MSGLMRFILWLAAAAVIAFLVLWFWCRPNCALDIQGDVKAGSEQALGAAGYGWANVAADGQHVTLTGVAPSEAAKAELEEMCKFGIGLDGVEGSSSCTSELTVAAPAVPEPFDLTWTKSADGIVLTGRVPDEATKSAIVAHAEGLNAGPVTDRMTIDAGIPFDGWRGIADKAANLVPTLQDGWVRLRTRTVTISGLATTIPAYGQGVAALSSFEEPWAAEQEDYRSPAPAVIEDVNQCMEQLNALVRSESIHFATSSADIQDDSLDLLERISGVASRCAGAQIEVQGHTDDVGSLVSNKRLSQRRADAVTQYMATHGVTPETVSGKGYGETRPRADNTTEEGRAQNRRIEFLVTERSE